MKLDDRTQRLICILCALLQGQVEAHQAGLSARQAGAGLSACQREISVEAGMITFTCPWPNNLAACQSAELRANPAR